MSNVPNGVLGWWGLQGNPLDTQVLRKEEHQTVVGSRFQWQIWTRYHLCRVRTPEARSSHLANFALLQQFLHNTELVLALLTLPDTLPLLPTYTQMLVQSYDPCSPSYQSDPRGKFLRRGN